MRLTLLDGSTFVVCDERGDVDGVSAASGFFAADTRFLSRSVLTIDGDRGEPVGFEQSAPHVGVFELEWETGLAVRRELFVGRGLEEAATVWNRSDREVEVVLELELASDFADIFAVKRVEDLGAPGTRRWRRRDRSTGRTHAPSSSRTKASRRGRSCICRRRPTRPTAARRATGCDSRPASAGSSASRCSGS